MRNWLSLCFLISIVGNLPGQQLPEDTLVAKAYLSRMLLLLEDESKEDSLLLLAAAAAEAYRRNGLLEDYVQELIPKTRALFSAGYLEAADSILGHCLVHLQQQSDENLVFQANIYYEKARGRYIFRQYRQTLEYLQQGIGYRVKARQEWSAKSGDEYTLLGLTYKNLGQLLSAIEYTEKAIAIYQRAFGPDSFELTRPLNNLALIYQQIGLPGKALQHYESAYAIRSELLGKEHPGTASIVLNMGVNAKEKGDYNRSINYFQSALEVYEKQQEAEDERIGELHYNLGTVYKIIGRMQESELHFQHALRIFSGLPEAARSKQALALRGLANLRAEEKQFDAAIRLRAQVLALQQEIYAANDPEIAITYDNIGVDYRESGQLDSSLLYHQRAISMLSSNEEYPGQMANALINLADAYIVIKEWEKARETVNRALTIQQDSMRTGHTDLAYSWNTLARIALGAQQPGLAFQHAQAAIMVNHEVGDKDNTTQETPRSGYRRSDYYFESIMLKATALQLLDKAPAALEQYLIADEVLNEARNRLLSREDKLRQSQNVYRLTREAIQLCVALATAEDEPHYLQQAFRFAEKSKASVLLQSINANSAKHFAGLPDSLIAREEQLQSDINYYSLQLAGRPDDVQTPLFQQELLAAREAYKTIIDGFERDFPAYYELRHANIKLEATDIQADLPLETALISYFTADSILYTFYLDQERFQVYQSSIDEEFLDDITGFRKGIAQQLPFRYAELAQELYPTLFPFELPATIQHLVLIPDGQLTSIPYEALLTQRFDIDAGFAFSELPYLVKQYEISYTPSASLYYQFRNAPVKDKAYTSADLIAFAPVFSDNTEVTVATRNMIEPLGDIQRTYIKDGTYVTPLPATANELASIQQVFDQHELSGISYTHSQATEVRIKSPAVSQCHYLHIATHGFINETLPDLSGLLLYPDSSSLEDGVLNSGEVYSLKLNAELVVLSACETGIGKISTGEGILGLSRAFLYAGANNLMVSLWKVDDRATAELMTTFYRRHLAGKSSTSFAEALRAAKLSMIASEELSMPYFWSSFVLIGH